VEGSGEAIGQDLWKFGTTNATYVKRQGAWAFVSNTAEALAAVPPEPTLLLDDLDLEHSLAARVIVSRLSARDRSLLFEAIKLKFMDGVSGPQQPSADQVRQVDDAFDKFFSTLGELGLEMSMDRTARSLVLDIDNIMPPEGTQFRSPADAAAARPASAFAGLFLPGEAASLHVCYQLGDQDAQKLRALFAQARDLLVSDMRASTGLSATHQQETQRLIGELHDALTTTVAAGGKFDAGASLLIHPDKPELHVIAGLAIGDGERAERALKRLVELNPPSSGFEVRWDAANYRGVRLHTISGPMDDPQGRRMFGDRLTIVVGFAQDRVYLALGPGGLETLKRAMDASAGMHLQPRPDSQISVRLTPLLRLDQALNPNPLPRQALDRLAATRGNDRLAVEGSMGSTSRSRLTIDEGVLRLIGELMAEK
jgi:hypothetical protein